MKREALQRNESFFSPTVRKCKQLCRRRRTRRPRLRPRLSLRTIRPLCRAECCQKCYTDTPRRRASLPRLPTYGSPARATTCAHRDVKVSASTCPRMPLMAGYLCFQGFDMTRM